MNHTSRRNFLFASSGALAGSLLVPGAEAAEQDAVSLHAGSGLITGTPKPVRHREIPGFLSAAQVAPHHTAHYGGALKAFVGIEKQFEEQFAKTKTIDAAALETLQRQQSSRGNSVILHELYFDGLALKATDPAPDIRRAIEKRFGSMDNWASDFLASAKSAAGWAILVVHPINGRLYNLISDEHAHGPLWMSVPLVVIDTYEHAFYIDYQNRKADYIQKFLQFIDWAEVNRRFQLATTGAK